jgi:hypothetical protein
MIYVDFTKILSHSDAYQLGLEHAMARFSSTAPTTSPHFLCTASVVLFLLFPVWPLLSQECPAVIEPKSHNDPPLLLISLSQPEIGQEQEQQIKVSVALPFEGVHEFLETTVSCKTEDNVRFGGITMYAVRHSTKALLLRARLPGFTGRGGTCTVRVRYTHGVVLPPQAEAQFRLLNGPDPGKQPPRLISPTIDQVTFANAEFEGWENQDPALSSEAVKELHNAAEGTKEVVMRLHDTICNNTVSERGLWNVRQGVLAVIQSTREHLLKNSVGPSPSQALHIEVFTHDLEERLLELNLTDPRLKTGTARERPAAFNLLSGSDRSEITRKNANALLHEAETIWDALTDAENTKLLYLALSITSCPTHSTVEYNAKGYSPDTARTDAIIQLTKARIHFKVIDLTTSRKIEFDRDFFAQPERRVTVWCRDDPNAEEWYVE